MARIVWDYIVDTCNLNDLSMACTLFLYKNTLTLSIFQLPTILPISGMHRRIRFGGQPGHVPPIIKKLPCIHRLFPLFLQYFGFPPQYFVQVYTSVYAFIYTSSLEIELCAEQHTCTWEKQSIT